MLALMIEDAPDITIKEKRIQKTLNDENGNLVLQIEQREKLISDL